jgi:Ca-activated chloride channel family protein
MMAVTLYDAGMLKLLWTGAAVAGLLVYGWRMRQKNLRRFADQGILERLGGKCKAWREWFRGGCVCVAALMIVLALCRPAWDAKEVDITHSGRDIVFVLDVSRSMFAQDMQPNRLARAKRAIMDCTDEFTGDRVGLIVFAGTASIKCPLTRDYSFFRTVLRDVSWDSAQIGGTRIGDAIQKGAEHLLSEQRSGYQDIIMITDGEDHESRPEEAAAMLKTGGIRLIAVGIGDAYQGTRIKVEEETGSTTFLQYQGQEVRSRLNAPLLRRIADAAGQGVFWEVGTGAIDLAGIYRQDIATAQRTKTEAQTVQVYEEKFQWFLAGALVLMLLRRAGAFWRSLAVRGALLAILCGLVTQGAYAGEVDGLRAYNEGRFAEAVGEFQQMLDAQGKSPTLLYNLGVSLYKHGDYKEASDAFDAATLCGAEPELRLRCVYNEGNCMFRMAESMAQRGPDGLTMNKEGLTEMIALYAQSSRCLRAVLKADSRFEKAAFNIELVKIRMREAGQALKAAEEAEQMLAKQLVYARKTLAVLFTRQEQLADETADIIEWQTEYDIPRIIARQRLILTETDEVNALMKAAKAKLPNGPVEKAREKASLPDKQNARSRADDGVFRQSLEQLAKSIKAQASALKDLAEKRLDEANEGQYMAADALGRAWEAFPEKTELEGEDRGDTESEGAWTGRVEEGAEGAEGQVFELATGEIDPMSLSAPDLSPEAILREEIMNRRKRQRKRSAKYGNVERNW